MHVYEVVHGVIHTTDGVENVSTQPYTGELAMMPGPPGPGGSGDVVYRPGGVPIDNVFDTWAGAHAAATALAGSNGIARLQIADSIVSPAPIGPAAVYDFLDGRIWLTGRITGSRVLSTVGGGVSFVGLANIRDNLSLVSVATTPIITPPSGTKLYLNNGAQIASSGQAAPFISLSLSKTMLIELDGFNSMIGGGASGGAPTVEVAEGSTCNVYSGELSEIATDAFTGQGTLAVRNASASSFLGSQAGLFFYTIDRSVKAKQIDYTPTTATDWNPPPDSPHVALDQLAARVMALEAVVGAQQIDDFTAIATQTIFTLTQTPLDVNDVEFFVNGIAYEGDEYTVVGNVLTWNNTAFTMAGGEECRAVYQF